MKTQCVGMLAAPFLLLLFAVGLKTTDVKASSLLLLFALGLKTTGVKAYRGFKPDYQELHSLQERK